MTLFTKPRPLSLLLCLSAFALAPAVAPAQSPLYFEPDDEPYEVPLFGRVEGRIYFAPSEAYHVVIPVLPELGGEINDTEFVVTFQDAFAEHASIGCFPMDTAMREEAAKRDRKDFLVWFFTSYIQTDFQRSVPGAKVESARFLASTQGGSLLTFLLLPNASVFAERVFIFNPIPPPVAKRGALLFIKNDFVYVLSIELAERIVNHSTHAMTITEEDELLRSRLLALLGRMTFTDVMAPATIPVPVPIPVPSLQMPQTDASAPSVSLPAGGTPAQSK